MTTGSVHPRLRALGVALACAAALVGCKSEQDQRAAQLKNRDPFLGEKIPPPNVPTGRDKVGSKDTRDPFLRADANLWDANDGADLRTAALDRRPSGSVTSRALSPATGATADQLSKELERVGAKVFSPTRSGQGYEVKVQVPSGATGAMSGYVGSGPTGSAALRDAYDQVRADAAR